MIRRLMDMTARELAPDRLVIHYLDGTSTASPVSTGLRLLRTSGVSTPRLLAALSTALDLTEGQLPGHAVRTAFLAMRVADELALDNDARTTVFHTAFLKDAGCSSNAAAVSSIFGGDDIELKGRQSVIDRSLLASAAFAIRSLPSTEPLPRRLRRLIHLGLKGPQERTAIEQLRCERGASIARKAGFGDDVASAVHDVHEHWDGGGQPRHIAGDDIHPHARIVSSCAALDVFASRHGRKAAVETLTARRGRWYEPAVVDILLSLIDRGVLGELDAPDLVGRTLDLAPPGIEVDGASTDVDRLALAFAEIVDAKSPFTGSHSQSVAGIAERIAIDLGLPDADVVDVRRAALLHDIGKLGVPNSILDKPARLEASEFEVIRRHPELSLRILSPVPAFAAVAEMAACHHERLDGRGYFRGLTEPELSMGARIVAVADVYEALTANRPYRPAMPREAALAILREEAGRHLASDVVETLAASVA
jgi:putative nucleotidyltransferase with HDIG domain